MRDEILQHWRHPEFVPESNARQLTIGFRCSCIDPPVQETYVIRDAKADKLIGEFLICLHDIYMIDAQGLRFLQRGSFDAAYAAIVESKRIRDALRELTKEATARAKELLLENLTDSQRDEYLAHRHFFVVSQDGGQYRIENSSIFRVDGGIDMESYCIHPEIAVPTPDNMLVAKLLLECDFDRFKRVAHKVPLH